ncbi:hypothetical protein O3M35_005205 [Rhynocoris fuscipes]|uniref:Uncharacterized protein n=1 Tax=Rhynocoris fuscipes TaxID=488301 RepID=A0AAW1DJL0_9HEMI
MAAIRFNNSMLDSLPSSVTTIDFHGDLYYRDRTILKMDNQSTSWLPDTEFWLRRLKLEMTKQPSLEPGSLREIHFGEVKVTGAEIAEILKSFPQLEILRHYQLTTGLCLLHGKDWEKTEENLPKYNLTNIDADFSHVIRCRMSPEAVLPSDALKLAVTVCPKATSVNLRYDCSTPHHIVGYLTSLTRLQELSAVCVTSGERTLLDFNDLVPILEKFGPKTLKSLELKVLEEVDPHVIAYVCPQLTRLILSGCGYVTPSTCFIYRCLTSSKRLPKLKLLFYADGDDFSWDHSLPQCFWKSVLESDIRQPNILEGIFLESPRMTVETLTYLLNENADFPNLQVFSICRASELNLSHLQSLSRAVNKLNYLRITDCEQIGIRLGARIIQMFRGAEVKIES